MDLYALHQLAQETASKGGPAGTSNNLAQGLAMRLYTFCDSRFARLQRRFLESLCDDYEVICHEFSNFTSAAGNAWFGGLMYGVKKPA